MIIFLNNISKNFGANEVLKDVTIKIDKRECIGGCRGNIWFFVASY